MLKALTKQIDYAGSTHQRYGYDQSGDIEYQFNSSGFRGELVDNPNIIFVGGSISFGVGIKYAKTYGCVLSSMQSLSHWNISYAQEYYDNEIIYQTVLQIHKLIGGIPIVIQWVSDTRNPKAVYKLDQLIDMTNQLFKDHVHLLIDGRDKKEEILTDHCDLINPPWLDSTADHTHPGIKTHNGLAKFILKKLYDKNIFTRS
jgi:hypothetical protein